MLFGFGALIHFAYINFIKICTIMQIYKIKRNIYVFIFRNYPFVCRKIIGCGIYISDFQAIYKENKELK